MRTRFGPNGNQTTQDLINSVRNRSNAPSLVEIESKESHYGFDKLMALNGWYWEPYSPVVHIIIENKFLARIERPDASPLYKTIPELKTWLTRTGYEKGSD